MPKIVKVGLLWQSYSSVNGKKIFGNKHVRRHIIPSLMNVKFCVVESLHYITFRVYTRKKIGRLCITQSIHNIIVNTINASL